eukprot:Phypoly_transcript_03890.p1 GENE.Phypoly_transcript_03890~~Phypoly_transcript_03890.p1  ORF type:complete len:751 (+),score=110.62 Phypoly_transcript_03890:108-2255(+)
MRSISLILVLFSVFIGINARFSPENHHKLGWTKLTTPKDVSQQIKFSLFLKQQNLHVLEKTFWDVSDPKSESYAKYLSMEEITQIVSPSEHTISKVTNWLAEHDITDIEFVENKDVVVATAHTNKVEQLLSVSLANFQHTSGKTIVRADAMYTIPSHLTEHIDFIRGVSNFPMVSPRTKILHNSKPKDKSHNGKPIIEGAQGISNQFIVFFTPTCLSSPNTTTVPPCQDHPPALTEVTVHFYSALDAVESSISVTGVPSCDNEDGTVSCMISVNGVVNYLLYNFSVQASFAGGKTSDVVVFPYSKMASPALTAAAVKSYYNIPINQRVKNANVTQSVAEFEQQYYDDADNLLYFKAMGLPYDTPVTVIGPNDQSNPGGEAILDIQWIMGIAPGAPTTFWSIYANSTIEIDDILAWAVAMSNTADAPIVNSLSYGMTETAVDKYLGSGYLNRSDVEFQKLALRGITIIIADGDTGAGDLGEPPMSQGLCKPLHADWPSQSPYVTAVSATMFTSLAQPICYLPLDQGGVDCSSLPLGEVPTSVELGTSWTTGGGFANTTSRPSYQDDFVTGYLKTLTDFGLLPPAGYFNPNGRAYPDVAMVGHNLLCAQDLVFSTADGTSASAPVFGGFVSLLNDIRVSAGRPLLGFLNPILYQIARDYPEAYNDVVVGNNRCGATDDPPFAPVCCPYGFEAVAGFDAVSGLGSPNFAVFSDVILKY